LHHNIARLQLTFGIVEEHVNLAWQDHDVNNRFCAVHCCCHFRNSKSAG
jgi:hypothetical protein